MSPRDPGRPPRQLPLPEHLVVVQWDDLEQALDDAERVLEPPRPVRVQWSSEWHAPALLHGWQRDEHRGGGWLGCVEYYRQFAPGSGYAVGRWTPVWNIQPLLGRDQ